MATPSTKEFWSALCALLDGPDFLGSMRRMIEKEGLFTREPMRSEESFVWNAGKVEPAAKSPCIQTYVQSLQVYSTIPQLTTGTLHYSKLFQKFYYEESSS